MGCFPSKHAMRSRSLRHDFSFSLQRRTVGVPVLEDLFTSKASSVGGGTGGGSGDDFLALLCTANTVAMKLKEREEKLRLMSEAEQGTRLISDDRGADEPVIKVASGPQRDEEERDEEEVVVFHEAINAWELLAGLEDTDEAADASKKQQQAHADDNDLKKRAGGNSFVSIADSAKELDDHDRGENGRLCAEKNRLTSRVPLEEDVPVDKLVISSSESLGTSSVLTQPGSCGDDDDSVVKNVDLGRKPLSEIPMKRIKKITEVKPVTAGNMCSTANLDSFGFSLSFRFKGSIKFEEDDDSKQLALGDTETTNHQKGARRKAISRDLKPIEVPTFEFKDIQQWLQGDEQGLYDSDPYETPKFGKYIRSIAKIRKEGDEELDQELIASLQETIDGMTAEEEHILKQFVEEFLQNHGEGCGGSL